jgi:hypothetical protein
MKKNKKNESEFKISGEIKNESIENFMENLS